MVRNDHAAQRQVGGSVRCAPIRCSLPSSSRSFDEGGAVMATQERARDVRHEARGGIERFDTIVIGGGQAGLSVGYYLKKQGRPFVILDANEQIGGFRGAPPPAPPSPLSPAPADGPSRRAVSAPGWAVPTAPRAAPIPGGP